MAPTTDDLVRPAWASHDPLLRAYYDEEWGAPVRDERGVFERLSLEVFLAGLSWATILRKRENFRTALDGFDVELVAAYGPEKVQQLLGDPGIVRNQRKIDAVITNARATLALRPEGGLHGLVWSYATAPPLRPQTEADIPVYSPEAVALSKDLKARGFTFVGPTTLYALMQAIGIVDARLVGSSPPTGAAV